MVEGTIDPMAGMKADPLAGMKTDGKEEADKITSTLQFLFDPQRDNVPNKPYHEDGDIKFYSVKERKSRKAMRTDPVVKESIENFMQLFNMSGPPSNRVVQKDEYVRIFTKIAEALYHGS
jgi:hypothetical protein